VPFVFDCSECESVIYVDLNPRLSEGYLETLLARLGGKCPKCGHKLQLPPLKVEVLPLNSHNKEKLKELLSRLKKLIENAPL